MAARGNRSGGVVPVGVAVAATVVAALGFAQSAFAQDAPPPPPPAASTSTSAPDPPPPADSPPAATNPSEPPPAATPPDAPQATTETTSTQSGSTETSADKPADAPPTETASTTTATAEAKPASESKTDATAAADAVKLEPEAPATATSTTAGPPATPAAPEPAATPSSGAPPAPMIQLQNTQIAAAAAPASTASPAAAPASSAAANAEAVAQVAAVSFRPHSAVALDFDDAPALEPAGSAAVAHVFAPLMSRSASQACTQPRGLVPLAYDCKLYMRSPAARGTLAYLNAPSPEVRAAIDRGAARAAATRAKAALPRESKAAKERPIPKLRPILPFGGVVLGALQEGGGGVAGSTSSSRMFALAAAPLRVPRPFRLARLRLPTTIAHGVLAAPPPARPG